MNLNYLELHRIQGMYTASRKQGLLQLCRALCLRTSGGFIGEDEVRIRYMVSGACAVRTPCASINLEMLATTSRRKAEGCRKLVYIPTNVAPFT